MRKIFAAAVLAVVSAGLGGLAVQDEGGSPDASTLVKLSFSVQVCDTKEFALLFDRAARETRGKCRRPLKGLSVRIVTVGGVDAKAVIKEKGIAKIGPVLLQGGVPVQLVVCRPGGDRCFHAGPFIVGQGNLTEGHHEIRYETGGDSKYSLERSKRRCS